MLLKSIFFCKIWTQSVFPYLIEKDKVYNGTQDILFNKVSQLVSFKLSLSASSSGSLMKDLAQVEAGHILAQRLNRSPRDHDSLLSFSWRLGNHQVAVGINDFPRTSVSKAWPGRALWGRQQKSTENLYTCLRKFGSFPHSM